MTKSSSNSIPKNLPFVTYNELLVLGIKGLATEKRDKEPRRYD